MLIKLTLLKAESNKGDGSKTEGPITQYTPLRMSYGILRFTLNTFCEYVECTFQEPFLSTISALMFVQPMQISIDFKEYRSGDGEALLQLRKEVKKLRYNSYLVCNKFKKVFYSVFAIDFTLPGLFLDEEGTGMDEVVTDE